MRDERVRAVEDNLEHFLCTTATASCFTRGGDADVVACWSVYPFPLLNCVSGARFASGTVEQRAHEVVGPFLERGLPFLWWATPSGHGAELGPVLTALGMSEQHVPGMYVETTAPVDPAMPQGVEIQVVDRSPELEESLEVMADGFGLPEFVREVFSTMDVVTGSEHFAQVTARLDGEAVACGTAWIVGEVAGLYNIAVRRPARDRGIGYAVTATLMNLARDRGAPQVVLHASEAGFPLYQRLGFEAVCDVPQFVWLPEAG